MNCAQFVELYLDLEVILEVFVCHICRFALSHTHLILTECKGRC